MDKRLAWVALLAMVACKGKEDAAAQGRSDGRPGGADSATAQVASAFAQAADALAQAAAASAATVASSTPSASAAGSASAAPTADGFSPTVSNELGRLGFSTAPADLSSLGKDRGLLLKGLGRLAGHPSALSAIFNSDKVVSAFTKRPDMQDACRDQEKLKPLLLYVLSSTAARTWVDDPASIKAFTGSKLGLQLQACASFKALVQQPKALATLTKDSPAAIAVVNHPNFRAELDRLKIRQDATGLKFTKKPLK
jgi:hypothetical protein